MNGVTNWFNQLFATIIWWQWMIIGAAGLATLWLGLKLLIHRAKAFFATLFILAILGGLIYLIFFL